MLNNIEHLFDDLLKATEIQEVDYKENQYRLDNEHLKAKFIKAILCMANAPGGDAYILLGVKAEKGKPREVTGVSSHYDSSDLEQIVSSVIEDPIQFDYYQLVYQGRDCGLIHIPPSKSRLHWPKTDYGGNILKRHIFYTRRASGNREASKQEIQQICIETIRLSDIAQRKARVSRYIVDELINMGLDERKSAMYKMLKNVVPKIGSCKYNSIISRSTYSPGQVSVLVSSISDKAAHDYAIFMYPWVVNLREIQSTRNKIIPIAKGSLKTNLTPSLRTRIKDSTLVHISYKNISTRALQSRYYDDPSDSYRFANEWNEQWGRVIKWEADIPKVHLEIVHDHTQFVTSYQKKARYEFFLPNVSSKDELQDHLEKLLAWADSNITKSAV